MSKEYVCGYNHCLHKGEKVPADESVVISGRHYHWDCAEMKQSISLCTDTYMSYADDKTIYPAAAKIINTLVFKYRVPPEYILKELQRSKIFYKTKPVHVLYGLRTLFWQKEMLS